jgi:hypothetical protein
MESSHVSAQGKLFSAASAHDHTRFLMNVITLLPDNPAHKQEQSQ